MLRCLVLFLPVLFARVSVADIKQPASSYGFIENKGQIMDQHQQPNPAVLYLYSGNGLHVQLRKNAFSYEVIKTERNPNARKDSLSFPSYPFSKFNNEASGEITLFIHRVDISFLGANPASSIEPYEPSTDYINYYTTGTPEEGVLFVNRYKKILYKNLYPLIDVEFLLDEEGGFKYNFIVYPGGNVNDIKLKFGGATSTSITSQGNILVETTLGNLEERIPLCFTVDETSRTTKVEGTFWLHAQNTYGIRVSEYNSQEILIIDPIIWGTYFGGAAEDYAYGTIADKQGNVYVGGSTRSGSNIATSGAHKTIIDTSYIQDAFLSKFNSQGTLLWSTYYGGNGLDAALALVMDTGNNVLLTGYTNSFTGIATSGSFQPAFAGNPNIQFDYEDAFIVKFNPAGIRTWGTYFGKYGGREYGNSIACDINGNIFIAGTTGSSGLATTGAHQEILGYVNNGAVAGTDAFLAKFNSLGGRVWCTYYGGNAWSGYSFDEGYGVATDSNGNVFMIGVTQIYQSGIIATSGSYQSTIGGGGIYPSRDAFIVKFNSQGVRQWGTYYGGAGEDRGYAIATDRLGNLFVTGLTNNSTSTMASAGAFQATIASSGYEDAFVAKFNTYGNRVWGTYFGGLTHDRAYGICVDSFNNVTIIGATNSDSGLASPGAWQTYKQGNNADYDAFLAKFSSTGSRIVSTYYGGQSSETGWAVANASGSIDYIVGSSNSATKIAIQAQYQGVLGGNHDGFLAKFDNCSHIFSATVNSPVCQGSSVYFTTPSIGVSGNCRFHWTGPNGYDTIAQNPVLANVSVNHTGSFRVIRYDSGSACIDTVYISLQVHPKPNAAFAINDAVQCLNGNSFVFTDMSSIDSGSFTRFWRLSNGDTSSTASFSRSFSAPDTFLLKLMLFSGKNCKDSLVKKITVFPSVQAGFTLLNQSSCDSHQYVFTDTSTLVKGIYQRLWKFSDGSTADTFSVTKVFNAAGSYPVKLLVTSDSGCVDSVTKTLSLSTPFAQPKAGFLQNSMAQCLNGGPFLFEDTSVIGSGTVSGLWQFSDSSSYIGDSIGKTFGMPGSFVVKRVVVSDKNCWDSVSRTVTVHPQTAIGFTINHSTQCIQNNFILTDTSSLASGSYSRTWQLGDGNTSSLAVVTKSYAVGSYAVTLKTVTNLGCIDSMQQNIKVLPFPKPEAGFTLNEPDQCFAGNSFVFTDTSSISSGSISRDWTFGDASNGTNNPFVKNYADTGTFLVRLMVTSDQNCMDSVKKWVTVHPQPRAGFSSNSVNQCLNENSFVLNDTSRIGAGILSTSWNLGDNTTSLNKNVVKNFTAAGNYTILLRVISDKNCSDSVARLFSVFPQTNVGFTVSGSNSQCQRGNIFTFTDTSSISNGTFSRLWLLGDGSNAGTVSVSKSYTNAGSYVVRLITTTDKGCMDTAQKNVLVYQQPVARFDINDSVQCFIEHDFVLTDNSFAGLSYNRLWNLGDGNLNTNNLVHKKYSDTGRYVVQLLIIDDNNCRDSTGKNVQVKQNPQQPHIQSVNVMSITSTPAYRYEWFLDNIPVPNSNRQTIPVNVNGSYVVKVDSSNGCSNSSYPLNISFIHDGEIKIYPNPNRGDFIIDFNGLQGEKNIHVFNVLGQSVAQYSSSFNKIRINMDNRFAKGVYVLEILSSAGVLFKKVIVE